MTTKAWYTIENSEVFDTPLLLLYPDRIRENIRRLVEAVNPVKLRPHVKTNKTAEVCAMMISAGISKFKAATIAEVEMLAMIDAPDILLAYQPTAPKAKRLSALIRKYPNVRFSCLIDNGRTAEMLAALFMEEGLTANIFIDVNLGMNRTGVIPDKIVSLFEVIRKLPALQLLGLHAYDGHIKDPDFLIRQAHCYRVFDPVLQAKKELENRTGHTLTLVAGGSPTSFIHAEAGDRECSPGTFVFWDKGYSDVLYEQPFQWAALVACRVISIPESGKICVDLGYKSVASENPLPRVYFLNATNAIPSAHSEEHLVLDVPDSSVYKPGDLLYGVPYHICPSVALYDEAMVVEKNQITGSWPVIARKRRITV